MASSTPTPPAPAVAVAVAVKTPSALPAARATAPAVAVKTAPSAVCRSSIWSRPPLDWPFTEAQWNDAALRRSLSVPEPCKHGDKCYYQRTKHVEDSDSEDEGEKEVCKYVHPGEEGLGLKYYPARSRTGSEGKKQVWEQQDAIVRLHPSAPYVQRRKENLPWNIFRVRLFGYPQGPAHRHRAPLPPSHGGGATPPQPPLPRGPPPSHHRVPYQQGPYQQGPYQQAPYQQGPYHHGPSQVSLGAYVDARVGGSYPQGSYLQGPHRPQHSGHYQHSGPRHQQSGSGPRTPQKKHVAPKVPGAPYGAPKGAPKRSTSHGAAAGGGGATTPPYYPGSPTFIPASSPGTLSIPPPALSLGEAAPLTLPAAAKDDFLAALLADPRVQAVGRSLAKDMMADIQREIAGEAVDSPPTMYSMGEDGQVKKDEVEVKVEEGVVKLTIKEKIALAKAKKLAQQAEKAEATD